MGLEDVFRDKARQTLICEVDTELIEGTGSAGHGLRVKKIEQTDGGIDGVTAEALINGFT